MDLLFGGHQASISSRCIQPVCMGIVDESVRGIAGTLMPLVCRLCLFGTPVVIVEVHLVFVDWLTIRSRGVVVLPFLLQIVVIINFSPFFRFLAFNKPLSLCESFSIFLMSRTACCYFLPIANVECFKCRLLQL